MNKPRNLSSRLAAAATLGWSDTERGRLALRRGLSGALRGLLRLRSRPFDRQGISAAVVIAPHPDDESFGCGGTLCFLSRMKVRTFVIILTDGAASHPGHPTITPDGLAAVRRAEAIRATAALGVDPERVWFLDEPDGTLARLSTPNAERLLERITEKLVEAAPDAVLLPWRRDGSSEHEAAFGLVALALRQIDWRPRILEFPVWSWWNPLLLIPFVLTSGTLWRVGLGAARAVKAEAISLYPSQTAPIPPNAHAALPAGFSGLFLADYEYLIEH